jgi:hypothetical protein
MKYCFGCPVRAECGEARSRTDSRYGIWGGELFSDSE